MSERGDEELVIFENDDWRVCFINSDEGFVEFKKAKTIVSANNLQLLHNRVDFSIWPDGLKSRF